MRLCLAILSLTAPFVLLASSVHAGTFVWKTTDANGNVTAQSPVITGGKATDTEDRVSEYDTHHYDYTNDGSTGFGVWGPPLGIKDARGTVSVRYVWQPSDPGDLPPQNVIVTERRSAQWSAHGMVKPTASCSIGLAGAGNQEVDTVVARPPGSDYQGVASGSLYTLMMPDTNGVISFSVSGMQANLTYTADSGSAFATLSDQITVSPITFSLSGTTPDSNGNQNILIGQGCTASVSGIPDALLNNAAHPPVYNWSVSGTTFQSWTVTQNLSATPPTSIASAVTGPGPLTNSTAHWCWNDPIANPNTATETVTYAVTLTPPTGQGNTFTVHATKNVIVQAPAWTAIGRADYMQVNARVPNNNTPQLWAGPTDDDRAAGLGAGMIWQATVTTPTTPAFGTGQLELIQLVTPNDSYTTLTTPVQSYSDPLNGIQGLDLTYPYGNHVYSESSSSMYQDSDSPGIPLNGGGSSGTEVVKSATFASSYIDFLMYLPPGANSQWVAIAQYTWSTNGSATIPSTNNWSDYATQHQGSDAAGTINPQGTNGNGISSFGGVIGPAFYPTWTILEIPKHYPAPQ